MAQLEMENERGTYGPFERFLYLILIPVVFTAVLSVVLLSLFGYDVVNPLLRAANKVPVLSEIVPDPKDEAAPPSRLQTVHETEEMETEIAGLQEKLSTLNQELLSVQSAAAAKDERIAELEEQLALASQAAEARTLSEEEYAARIRDLASVYAGMSASKAAPVLEQLTLNERVLVLNQMKSDDQVKILEKMNPVIAAETSILLKDVTPAKDQQIAALQSRLALMESEAAGGSQALTADEVSLTLAGMPAASAAEVLLELYKTDRNKVIQVLRGMDVQSRSSVLDAIARANTANAAAITAALDG